MKIKLCPEGHDHTSDCRRNGCPCWEHKHTILSEIGQQGGKATLEKYGKEHFKKIAKGWPKGKKRKSLPNKEVGELL